MEISSEIKKRAFTFVILIGVVSLFADMTYESARSINGPFLAILGASGTVVGIVSGLGELIGYVVRFFSGFIGDRTKRYWSVAFVGYFINLVAVPLLALAGNWEVAAALMITERIGKGIRVPVRDAMLSYASENIKRGWAFGVHEALDQIGAVLGPLIVAFALFHNLGYRVGYTFLLLPALIALTVLLVSMKVFPSPRNLASSQAKITVDNGYPKSFWIYMGAASLIAAGFVDFPLIAYHFKSASAVPQDWIPVYYSIAMGVDALAALAAGRLFDRIGIRTLALVSVLSAAAAPLVFLGHSELIILGMVFWGISMGAQESIMRAAVADLVPIDKRGSGYGIFNTGFGIAWFIGSALMGVLYDVSILGLVLFSALIQLISIPLFLRSRKVAI